MSTFSYQTPVQFKWKWILYKLTLVSQSGWPLPRVPLNQGGPPCSSPAWPPGPRQGWATGSHRFWLLELRVSRTFLDQLRPQLLRPWIPNSMCCHYFLSSLGACRLFELRVSRTFLDNLRLICSVHGYAARRAARAADPDDSPRSCSTFEKAVWRACGSGTPIAR